jgi:hypothetical protein
MADIINLSRARKAKARDEHETQAAANRAKHGRTKAEKQAEKIEADRAAKRLDETKRET